MKLTSPKVIKQIMATSGLKFNKSLGQNFLIDENVLEKIVDESKITANHGVIEIGPGLGTLTQRLADDAKNVVSIELDAKIAEYLKSAFIAYNNVEILQANALKINFSELINEKFKGMGVCIVANLPYYITTPLIMKFLEENLPLESITVMIQKEDAERMVAEAGSKEYGALSLAVQYYSTPKIVATVPPLSFMPAPKVTSAIIRLDIKNHNRPYVSNEKLLFKIIKAAFGQRRKTLVNSLSSVFDLPKDKLKSIILDVCSNEKVRGESLKLCQYIQICEKMK